LFAAIMCNERYSFMRKDWASCRVHILSSIKLKKYVSTLDQSGY